MVTMIDGDLHTVPYNGHPAYPAWVPKVQGRQVNRLSGSLINRGMPGVYGYLPLGLILAPQAAQACLWCAYPFDAGSNGPMPCRSDSFLPSRFNEMMQQPQGHHSGVMDVYNEVVLHDDGPRPCFSSALPSIVEAVFVLHDADIRTAEIILERFTRHFRVGSESRPLLLKYNPGVGFVRAS